MGCKCSRVWQEVANKKSRDFFFALKGSRAGTRLDGPVHSNHITDRPDFFPENCQLRFEWCEQIFVRWPVNPSYFRMTCELMARKPFVLPNDLWISLITRIMARKEGKSIHRSLPRREWGYKRSRQHTDSLLLDIHRMNCLDSRSRCAIHFSKSQLLELLLGTFGGPAKTCDHSDESSDGTKTYGLEGWAVSAPRTAPLLFFFFLQWINAGSQQ
jgi:hypothetical protein